METEPEDGTPLNLAVMDRLPRVVYRLLIEGADINEKNDNYNGLTSLHIAVRLKYLNIAKMLLENGADANAVDNSGSTSLHDAASFLGTEKIVKLLLNHGANVDTKNNSGFTPVMHAVFEDNVKVLEMLIAVGANVDAGNDYTPLHVAASQSKNLKTLKLLIDAGADLEVKDKNGKTPLNWAVKKENIDTINVLIDAGANVNAISSRGTTLHQATAVSNNINIYKLLLKAGADVNARNEHDYSPLLSALFYSRSLDVVKLLLDAGCDINEKSNNNGFSPLHEAVQKSSNVGIVKFLLKSGADARAKAKYGYSPLHVAAEHSNSTAIVKLLMDAGADADEKNEEGLSSVHFTIVGPKNENVLKMLIQSGANVNAADKAGNTPLHFAVIRSNYNKLKMLIDAGADVCKRDEQNDTPLQMTAQYGRNISVIKLLIDSGTDISEILHRKNNIVTERFFSEILQKVFEDKDKVLATDILRSLIEGIDVGLSVINGDDVLSEMWFNQVFCEDDLSFFNFFLEHVAKLVILKLPVNSKVLDYISKSAEYSEYYSDCIEELKRAETTKLYNSWVTLLNLIVDDERKFVKYAGNKDLINDFKRINLKKNFPIFGERMKSNVNKGICGRKLFDSAANMFSYHLPIFSPAHLITSGVLDVLCERDWKNLSDRKRYNK